MKNVFKLMLGAAIVVLASCGGETANADQATQDSIAKADSLAKVAAADSAAAAEAAAAATASTDTTAKDSAK